jgi:hypothetical protein
MNEQPLPVTPPPIIITGPPAIIRRRGSAFFPNAGRGLIFPPPPTPRERQRAREDVIIQKRESLHTSTKLSAKAPGDLTTVTEQCQNALYELKKTIREAIEFDKQLKSPMAAELMNQKRSKKLSKRRTIDVPEPRELFHPIEIEMSLIDSLQNSDEIIFQLDTKPYNGFSIQKDFLLNFLTTHDYLQHTKYQCMGTEAHALMITENNIVYEHKNRRFFQFINGRGIGIPMGLFLRHQLINACKSQEKYFLIHIHKETDINPIVSADEVQWYAPPSIGGENISDWSNSIPTNPDAFIITDPDSRGLDETHTPLSTNIGADHCQASNGTNHLITIRSVEKSVLNYIVTTHGSTKRKRSGGRTKNKKIKRKTKNKKIKHKRKKKKTKKKKNRRKSKKRARSKRL